MPLACPCCAHSPSTFPERGQKGCGRLLQCPECGFVFVDPAIWRNPYAAVDYYDLSKQPRTDYPLRPTATERDRLAGLRRRIPSGKLLEFGGGVGRTAVAAQEAGFEVMILEESERAVEEGRKHHPQLTWVLASAIPTDLPPASFSVVTAFHVMEHIPTPAPVIESFAKLLKPGGYLLIEVPNWGSNLRKIQGLDWHFVMDHHVNYFTCKTLARLVEPRGFTLESAEYRRTFAINENQPWKEPLKAVACALGFGDVLRCLFRRQFETAGAR